MITLYKLDSKENMRTIKFWTDGAYLCQEAGLLDGNLVPNSKECKGKNIGKSNETTPEQQAILEMNSKVADKISEGYHHSLEEAYNSTVILPMLAKDFKKESHKVTMPVILQPKLDGMRCLAFVKDGQVRLQSRDGKTISTVPHINEQLSHIEGEHIFDGELYCHGISFQENMSLIKKYVEGETEKIDYVIYDYINNNSYGNRMLTLLGMIGPDMGNLKLITCYYCSTFDEIKQLHSKNLKEGYEGSIVRWGNKGYEKDARSQYLLKYKDFQDLTAFILDIVPSDARPEQGVLVCQLSNGKQFRASLKFSHKEREQILQDRMDYVGRYAEIRFFEYTDDGFPRFPVCVGFRLDKNKPD